MPRAFSFLGLWQYYGQLLPSILPNKIIANEFSFEGTCITTSHPYLTFQVKDFLKFLVIIAILYCGFFITFLSLGRDAYTTSEMGWFLVRIFFGSSYIGFDSMHKFGVFGPALMYQAPPSKPNTRVIFVCLTQIVLITVLISLLSNQFAKYNARDQYHFLFGIKPLQQPFSGTAS